LSCKNLGISRVLGIDGEWALEIEDLHHNLQKDEFIALDLHQPITINERFDLAICLEVAEHLSSNRAESLIQDLCQLSPVVCFSAAISNQGGQNHINEQMQSYWHRIFVKNGYQYIEIRPYFWDVREIDVWYKQNIGLYIRLDHYNNYSIPAKAFPIDIVHPDLYLEKTSILYKIQLGKLSLKDYLKFLLKPIYYLFK
jgi:hypothetical protein